jgi:hypothetical protein
MAVLQMPLAMDTRSAEHAERRARAADEPNTRQDQGAEQENAGGRTQQPHQAPALSRRVGEHGAAFRRLLIGVW